ncbi:MAG: hypothetical protein AAGE52_40235, partial [Myxococcota bacterium]
GVRNYSIPSMDIDLGDGRGILVGAALIRDDDGRVVSARLSREVTRASFVRTSLPSPRTVWAFEDATLASAHVIEPCESCTPWESPPANFFVVVAPEEMVEQPEPGWSIAVSP